MDVAVNTPRDVVSDVVHTGKAAFVVEAGSASVATAQASSSHPHPPSPPLTTTTTAESMPLATKNAPNGGAVNASPLHGSSVSHSSSSSPSATAASVHTTAAGAVPAAAPTNVWATRSQSQRPSATQTTQLSSEPTKSNGTSTGSSSAAMSRSSSRSKPKAHGSALAADHSLPPQLDDATAWPDVRETVSQPAAPGGRVEKEIGDRATPASNLQKKEKTKWVPMPPAELQAVFDANRVTPNRQPRNGKGQGPRPQSSPSNPAQSLRSSPSRQGAHDDVQSHTTTAQSTHPHTSASVPNPHANSNGIPRNSSHSTAAHRHSNLPPTPQTHPLPERPTQATTMHPAAQHQYQRRPAPAKSLPVTGWISPKALSSDINANGPLFGSFPQRLPVNSTPKLHLGTLPNSTAGAALGELPMGSPPSPSMFGPNGPFERMTKQRGKVAIPQAENPSTSSFASSSAQNAFDSTKDVPSTIPAAALGQDAEGWFTIDGKRSSLMLDTWKPTQPAVEFGTFDAPTPAPPSASSAGSSSHMSGYGGRRQGGAGPMTRTSSNSRRGSMSENTNGHIPYRQSNQSVGGMGGLGGRRPGGGATNGRNQRVGGQHSRSASTSNNNYASGQRSMSGPPANGGMHHHHHHYQQKQSSSGMRVSSSSNGGGGGGAAGAPGAGYAPTGYEWDPYTGMYVGYAAPGAGYGGGYYMGGGPGMYGYGAAGGVGMPGQMPYPPYPNAVMNGLNGGYGAAQNGMVGALPPPVPAPVTQLQVAVDPQQYWLLGQIEYYFSMQNLVNDMFLRQQMDSEGWVDIAMIASFKRMQNLTQDIALVHDTMLLSAFLEVTETRVRLSQRRWQDFVLPGAQQSTTVPPSTTTSAMASPPSQADSNPLAPHPHSHHQHMMSAAAYSLASSLSGLTLTGDDAATIQAKVTEAVLGTKSNLRAIAEAHGGEGGVDGLNGMEESAEQDENASNSTSTAAGSVSAMTGPTPAATSPHSSPETGPKALALEA